MKNKKIWLSFFLFLGIIVFFTNILYGIEEKGEISSFPQSYRPYLEKLKEKYPKWNFVALETGLDWNYVINEENQFGKNLVPKSYSDAWKNTAPGEYNIEVDKGWVDCSRKAIEYTMDPRNFLNEVRIFQFERLSYDQTMNSLQGVEKILYGTEFYNQTVEYLDSSGNQITMNKKYSDLILLAGIESKVSSYHLASRIKQEVGPFLSHSSISGTVSGYEGLYNFYNIGATSSAEPMGAIKNGLQYARDGKGASQEIKNKYYIPWNTKQKAITGGAIFIGSSYIHLGQDTIYFQKFHVIDKNGGELFWHQYMTNVLAPYSESKHIYNGYLNTGLLNSNITFQIPVYQNMPEIPVQSPNIREEDFYKDNTKVFANVSTTLNVRTGPSTSYEILTSINKNEVMTRIGKGKQVGELWDRVILSNGMIGYVFQSYLQEVPKIEVEEIKISISNSKLKKGETVKVEVKILPEEAKNHELEYSSSDIRVATVDKEGNILGIRSGKAIITVKAKENTVSNKIEIEVYTPVTDIQIPIETLIIEKENTYNLQASVYPEDADNQTIIYEVNNSDILTIDETGKITAKEIGIAKIQLKAEEIIKEIEVQIISKLQPEEIQFNKELIVNSNEISGWDTTNNTVEEIKKKINTKYEIEIENNQNKILENTEKIGTGSKIKLINEKNEIKMEYFVIIYGDVSGDGKINSIDLLVLQRHILEIEKLKGIFLKSGNIQKNGKNPSSLDSLRIQQHILGIREIEQ